MRLPTLTLLSLLLSLLSPTSAKKQPSDSVLLSKISTLTLRANSHTTSRRLPSIPQLQCIGGNACDLYTPDILRCTNSGSDYDDANVQWTCKASLPKEFKLGSTDVGCEGYESAEDPYVLKGSCGVGYRLVLTEEGEEKYGRRGDHGGSEGESSKGEKLLFWAFFTFVAGMIGYGVWDSCVRGNNRRGPNEAPRGGWGGNDGDDNNDDAPPPPYTPYEPKGGATSGYGTNQQPWRPGFWSGAGAGAAAGAAAGYMAGNRGSSSRSGGRSSGGWGSAGSSSGSTPPAPSSSRYESTGFGSSSRR